MPRSPEVYKRVFCPQVITNRGMLRQRWKGLPTVAAFSSAVCVVVLICLSFVGANAQSATATLSGTVKDQTGAVIPGASISVISIAQGFQRTAISGEDGAFVVPLLVPGQYRVKAEHAGFAPTEVRPVILNVNDEKAVTLYLKVGEISQTVEIIDGSNLRNQSPVVSTVIDRQLIQNLPTPGRTFQSLISLTP